MGAGSIASVGMGCGARARRRRGGECEQEKSDFVSPSKETSFCKNATLDLRSSYNN